MENINENEEKLSKEELIQLKVLQGMLTELKIPKFNFSINDISNYVGSINLIKEDGKFQISRTNQSNLVVVLGEYKNCVSACASMIRRLVILNNLNEVIAIFNNRVSEQLEDEKKLNLTNN